jgi:hypothetical protein
LHTHLIETGGIVARIIQYDVIEVSQFVYLICRSLLIKKCSFCERRAIVYSVHRLFNYLFDARITQLLLIYTKMQTLLAVSTSSGGEKGYRHLSRSQSIHMWQHPIAPNSPISRISLQYV